MMSADNGNVADCFDLRNFLNVDDLRRRQKAYWRYKFIEVVTKAANNGKDKCIFSGELINFISVQEIEDTGFEVEIQHFPLPFTITVYWNGPNKNIVD